MTHSRYNNPFPFMEDPLATPKPERYMTMPTPATLKSKSMFGIPLKSALTGETLSDTVLQEFINQAISDIEHSLNMFITPTSFDEYHDYDREIWTQQNAWIKLNNSPVQFVETVQLSFGNSSPNPPFVDFPMDFVYCNGQDGAVRMVPVLGTAASGFILSSFAGAQYMALIAAGMLEFPGACRIVYTAGFAADKVPALIAGLVEKKAAYLALSALAPILFPYNSVSIGIDGVSQSSGNSGTQFLVGRLQNLEQQILNDTEAAKSYYCKRILVDYI
jgi:hypothetical protein